MRHTSRWYCEQADREGRDPFEIPRAGGGAKITVRPLSWPIDMGTIQGTTFVMIA